VNTSREHLQIPRETPKENPLKNKGKHPDPTGRPQSSDPQPGFIKGPYIYVKATLWPGNPIEQHGVNNHSYTSEVKKNE
jgi:hypothetical protein